MTTEKAARGYTAVRIEFVDERAEKLTFTAKKDFTIEGVNGASVSIKAGEKFLAVKASSLGDGWWYVVRPSLVGQKKCSCLATKQCIHEKHIMTGKSLAELKAEVASNAKARKAVKTKVVQHQDKMPTQPVVSSEKVEAVATPQPRATYRNKDKCCTCYVDNDEPVDKAAYEAQCAKNVAHYEQWLAKSNDISTRGNLNGNKGFNLLKVS